MRNTSGNQKKSSTPKPYDVSNSFVKKIASRVSELFNNSLSNWHLNSSEGSDTNYSAEMDQNHRDVNVSTESQQSCSPVAKKRRINSVHPQTSGSTEVTNEWSPMLTISDSNDISHAGPSGTGRKFAVSSTPSLSTSCPVPRNISNDRLNYAPDTTEMADIFSDSSESTSGYSQLDRSTQFRHNVTAPTVSLTASDMSDIPITESLQQKLPKIDLSWNKRQPTFNTSVFMLNRKLSQSVCERSASPFYTGRTMYGGASSCTSSSNRSFLSTSTSAMKSNMFCPLSRNAIQIVPTQRRSNQATTAMSAAARKILDTLEQYSTPVLDAKRIPIKESATSKVASSATSASRCMKRKLPSLDDTIPTTSDLLKLKRREKLQESTSAARLVSTTATNFPPADVNDSDNSSSDSGEIEYPRDMQTDTQKPKYTGKIRVRDENKFDDRPVSIKLPNVSLNITSLPKISIPIPPKKPSDIAPLKNIVSTFTFSKPLLEEPNKDNKSVNIDSKSIDKIVDYKTNENKNYSQSKSNVDNNSKTKVVDSPKPFTPNNPTLLSMLKDKVCKVCSHKCEKEICDNCVAKKNVSISESNNISKQGVNTTVSSTTSGMGNLYKPPSDTWVCKECFVRNKTSDTNCVSCTAPNVKEPKPNSSLSTEPKTFAALPSKLEEVPKSDVDDKPKFTFSAGNTNVNTSSLQGFQFGNNTLQPFVNAGFKFGVDNSTTKLGSVSSSNPVVTYSFGINTSSNTDSSNANKPSFTFGTVDTDNKKLQDAATIATVINDDKGLKIISDNNNSFASKSKLPTVFDKKPNDAVDSVTQQKPLLPTNKISESMVSSEPKNLLSKFNSTSNDSKHKPVSNIFSDIKNESGEGDGKNSIFVNSFKLPNQSDVVTTSGFINPTTSGESKLSSQSITTTINNSTNLFSSSVSGNNLPTSLINNPKDDNVPSLNKSPFSLQKPETAPKITNIFGAVSCAANTCTNNFMSNTTPSAFTQSKSEPIQFNLPQATTATPSPNTNFFMNSVGTTDNNKFGGTFNLFTAPKFGFGSQNQNTQNFNANPTRVPPVTTTVNSGINFGTKIQSPMLNTTTAPSLIFGNASNIFSSSGTSSLQPTMTFGESTAEKINVPFMFRAQPQTVQQQPPAPTSAFGFTAALVNQVPNHTAGSGFAGACFAFGTTNNVEQPTIQPPSFNPTAQPVFNFTGSQVPQAFTAQPCVNNTITGQRRFKKAVRRAHK